MTTPNENNMPTTCTLKMSQEDMRQLRDLFFSKTHNFDTSSYHIYCDLCGGHNRPYNGVLIHKRIVERRPFWTP